MTTLETTDGELLVATLVIAEVRGVLMVTLCIVFTDGEMPVATLVVTEN